ncbi:hypothetical protein [Niabella drilacis]|uniref:Uncharacterized protein n=1 Tax=Niabella drilacis (strain DSM 25811 / CCM 8410 / CCUG 62505 / LMG 26954 / E90) TaxID=1285928 RepID=A0A1G6SGM7_NIADE|nr:hypothetical protein [Niabella drilacis]SDD15933.1 hypothetical protein SAMN04487894_106220 [Niabella drilacis]
MMAELGLFLIIAGPIVGGIILLVGIIQLFGNAESATQGRKKALIGLITIVASVLVGFSICSIAPSGGFH